MAVKKDRGDSKDEEYREPEYEKDREPMGISSDHPETLFCKDLDFDTEDDTPEDSDGSGDHGPQHTHTGEEPNFIDNGKYPNGNFR